MKFLRQKKELSAGTLNESDFVVLNYEQLLNVNGAGGGSSGGGGGGPSGPSSSSTSSSSSSNRGYPSSTEGYDNCNKGAADHTDVIATYEKNSNNTMHVSEITKDKNGNVVDVKYTDYSATNNVLTPEQRGNPVSYNGYNYYPTQFPDGSWTMDKSHSSSDPYIGPVSISTNASQNVSTYSNVDGTWTQTGSVNDTGYAVHSGTGNTTWGCIKMSDGDVASFANSVNSAIDSGGSAKLVVY